MCWHVRARRTVGNLGGETDAHFRRIVLGGAFYGRSSSQDLLNSDYRLLRGYTKNFAEIENGRTSYQGKQGDEVVSSSVFDNQQSKEKPTSDSNKNPGSGFYCLGQFPYPSGNIHLGHYRVYSIADSIYRYEMLRGSNVISPVGWDSFGLPAENAARDRKIRPDKWTETNIQEMKQDLLRTGLVLEFDRELATHRPEYYKWTQWIFLKLLERGLAYQKESWVNWDPIDNTVLANEQVDSKGLSWRSGAVVERIKMKQWYFKITAKGDQLYDELNSLSGWPESVKELQRGWIGKSKGHSVNFKVRGGPASLSVTCFTTRLETLPGVKFVAVHAHHEIIKSLELTSQQARELAELQEHVSKSREASLKEGRTCNTTMLGVCIHPLTGEEVPLYAADYVLAEYGTGAVMGVPAHDERDKRLASKVGIDFSQPNDSKTLVQAELDQVCLRGTTEGWVKESQMFALRDWLISRQRYWGAAIPIIYCKKCGAVPVPESELPVLLPEVTDVEEFSGKQTQRGRSSTPLNGESFRNCKCPKCSGPAEREIDTMDTFVDSSWYFLRFLDHKNPTEIFKKEQTDKFMPIKAYIGGMEHAIKHLLYARFIHKVLHDMDLVSCTEPFENIITQGLVMGKAVRLKSSGKYLTRQQAASYSEDQLETTVEKMSKSKFNGISPLEAVSVHGKDCVKLAMSLAGPVEKDIVIEDAMMANAKGLLDRIESFLLGLPMDRLPEESTQSSLEKVIREYDAGFHYKRVALHVAGARVIEMFNWMKKHQKSLGKNDVKVFLLLLYPFAPHMSEYLWDKLRFGGSHSQLIRDTSQTDIRKCFSLALGTHYTAGYAHQQSHSENVHATASQSWSLVLNNRPVPKKSVPGDVVDAAEDFVRLTDYLREAKIIGESELVTAVNKNPKKHMLVVATKGGRPMK